MCHNSVSNDKVAVRDIEDFGAPAKSHWVDLPPADDEVLQRLLKLRATRGIDKLDRHLFLCSLNGKGNCCAANPAGEGSWAHLKKRLKALKLDAPDAGGNGVVYRSKAECLRICQQGPICVVYPDGVWYHSVTPDVVDRIIEEHLLQGQIVKEYAFNERALTGRNLATSD